jgi:hypothetical protein
VSGELDVFQGRGNRLGALVTPPMVRWIRGRCANRRPSWWRVRTMSRVVAAIENRLLLDPSDAFVRAHALPLASPLNVGSDDNVEAAASWARPRLAMIAIIRNSTLDLAVNAALDAEEPPLRAFLDGLVRSSDATAAFVSEANARIGAFNRAASDLGEAVPKATAEVIDRGLGRGNLISGLLFLILPTVGATYLIATQTVISIGSWSGVVQPQWWMQLLFGLFVLSYVALGLIAPGLVRARHRRWNRRRDLRAVLERRPGIPAPSSRRRRVLLASPASVPWVRAQLAETAAAGRTPNWRRLWGKVALWENDLLLFSPRAFAAAHRLSPLPAIAVTTPEDATGARCLALQRLEVIGAYRRLTMDRTISDLLDDAERRTIAAAQLGELAEAERAPGGEVDHEAVPRRHGVRDGLQLDERRGADRAGAAVHSGPADAARVVCEGLFVDGRVQDGAQQAVGVHPRRSPGGSEGRVPRPNLGGRDLVSGMSLNDSFRSAGGSASRPRRCSRIPIGPVRRLACLVRLCLRRPRALHSWPASRCPVVTNAARLKYRGRHEAVSCRGDHTRQPPGYLGVPA